MGIGSNVILLIFAVLLVALYPDTADALTRSDLDKLQVQIKAVQKSITITEDNIISQKDIIEKNEKLVTEYKELFRQAKAAIGDSWDSLKFIDEAELNLTNAEKNLKESKDKLVKYLNEKSGFIKTLTALQDKLEKDKVQLRIENRYDYSHLVKLVGVQLSKNCITMIENNIPSDCPDPKDLVQLDSSITYYSGEFNEDGFREPSKFAKSWRAYDTDDQVRLIWDPPQGMADRIKMITIESSLDAYFSPTDFKLNNSTRTWSETVYIDNCNDGIISSVNWKHNLPVVISELRQGCINGLDEFDKSEVLPFTELDIAQTASWKYKIKMEQDKIRCKGLCFEY